MMRGRSGNEKTQCRKLSRSEGAHSATILVLGYCEDALTIVCLIRNEIEAEFIAAGNST